MVSFCDILRCAFFSSATKHTNLHNFAEARFSVHKRGNVKGVDLGRQPAQLNNLQWYVNITNVCAMVAYVGFGKPGLVRSTNIGH